MSFQSFKLQAAEAQLLQRVRGLGEGFEVLSVMLVGLMNY